MFYLIQIQRRTPQYRPMCPQDSGASGSVEVSAVASSLRPWQVPLGGELMTKWVTRFDLLLITYFLFIITTTIVPTPRHI